MLTQNFYKTIDAEFEAVAKQHEADGYLKKVKNDETNRKSYAFLIWFLEFYARKTDYLSYITDSTTLDKATEGAHKDIDASCDIVFDSLDSFGGRTFYVVQSKWNNANNCEKEISTTEIGKTLHDFNAILAGSKKNVNPKLASKLIELNQHIKENGKVKFIILCLCKDNPKSQEDINAFKQNQDQTELEVIDIDRLKKDYIDRHFKKILPTNPLKKYFRPKEEKVSLHIERLEAETGNFIKLNAPYKSYVFLIRPKLLHDWFDKYGFYLFYENVRNPLLQSNFNKDIEKTALDNSQNFWYYNNGITAISYSPFPDIRKEATEVELSGLQIINGAQTVYSIYNAYRNASPAKRLQMNEEVLITLRLLRSGGEDFDLKVTRYTNSQNPIEDRDFRANDPIQERLQQASFNTKYWYEKRRGEFRVDDEKVKKYITDNQIEIVENTNFALAYLAYHLQEPHLAFQFQGESADYLFLSHKEHQNGTFEKIFNENTVFEDMRCSHILLRHLEQSISHTFENNRIENSLVVLTLNFLKYHILASFKIVFAQYAFLKYHTNTNITQYFFKILEGKQPEIISKIFTLVTQFVLEKIGSNLENWQKDALAVLSNQGYYEKIREELENTRFTVEDIENIKIATP